MGLPVPRWLFRCIRRFCQVMNWLRAMAEAHVRFHSHHCMARLLNHAELKEERVMVLEAWSQFEEDNETDWVDKVAQRMPKKVKKRRLIDEDAGVCSGGLCVHGVRACVWGSSVWACACMRACVAVLPASL